MGGTSRKAGSNVFLAFVDNVVFELLARIAWYVTIELVKQIHHGWRDYRLMKRGDRLQSPGPELDMSHARITFATELEQIPVDFTHSLHA